MTKRKIIVAVLNWGLGHASRSIPVIKALQDEGFEPVLASDGEALLLLRKEFPGLKWLELPTYRITYPRQGRLMKFHFLLKGPRILKAVIAEHKAIKRFISSDGGVAGIISDNRLGAFSKEVPSAYMTHQLKLFSGSTSGLTTSMHHYFINQYDECWIPDEEGPDNLTGRMSQASGLKIPVKYLGILSRFEKRDSAEKYDLLVLLSGPEPQRSLLEEILLKELRAYSGEILFVRGKIEGVTISEKTGKMETASYLTGKELETALNSAKMILSRSGYSSIMDLAALGKKAFFIPTPGQYEQEYLAFQMERKKFAPFCAQKDFTLEELKKADSFPGFTTISRRGSLAGIFALFHGK